MKRPIDDWTAVHLDIVQQLMVVHLADAHQLTPKQIIDTALVYLERRWSSADAAPIGWDGPPPS
jgi:hypothetical protein